MKTIAELKMGRKTKRLKISEDLKLSNDQIVEIIKYFMSKQS